MQTVPSQAVATVQNAWRWLGRTGPGSRLALIGGLLGLVIAGGYLATLPDHASDAVWIYDGHAFPPDVAQRIVWELEGQKIAARAVGGRVEVRRDRLADARALLDKKNFKPASIPDLLDPATTASSPFDPPLLREQREQRRHERFLEELIRSLDDRLAPVVRLHRSAPRGLRATAPLKVSVWLRVEDRRPLSPELIEKIKAIVQSQEPDLDANQGLSVCDSDGRVYIAPNSPGLNEQMSLRARAEQIRADIEQNLDVIPGIRVHVAVEPSAEPGPPAAVPLVEPRKSDSAPRLEPAPRVSVNAPPDDDLPTEPITPVPAEPSRPHPGKVRVVVWVPSRYFLEHARAVFGTRSPSTSDLGAIAARTRETVRQAVELVVPPDLIRELTVEQIFVPGDHPSTEPLPDQRLTERREWLPAAVGGGVVVALVLLIWTGRWWSVRRAVHAPLRVTPRPHIELIAEGPADRVGELIRLDPAAAAGVLQRWIGSEPGGPEA